MIIGTNSSALFASRQLSVNSNLLQKSLARLSSGQRIVSPEDDAAGLAISMKLDAEVRRNGAASTILTNATTFSQTADGMLQQVQNALNRLSELSVLSQDSSKSASDISNYAAEFTQLQNFISDIGTKKFGSSTLFSSTGFSVPINDSGSLLTLNALDLNNAAVTIGLSNIFNAASSAIGNTTSAAQALSNVVTAISTLATMRALTGANIERLNFSNDSLSQFNTSLQAASASITNVDMASEAANFAKYQLLVQAGSTMLAQANAIPNSTLQILQNI